MFRSFTDIKFILAIILIVSGGAIVVNYSQDVLAQINEYDAAVEYHASKFEIPRRQPIYAKGIYLTASSAARQEKRKEIIDLITKTELNTVVIDIKDYSGHILYDSKIPIVDALGTDRAIIKNIRGVIREFKKAGIYVIARQTVFQDPALAVAKPEWAIRVANGSLWHDYKGLSWVDPTKTEVWEYNMAIASEAANLGFDEINFDYVRFPSDGNIRTAVYDNLNESKAETMRIFYSYVHDRMINESVFTSLDFFGLVLETHDFDLNIGQKLSSAINMVDYIDPMTYPSHYPAGYMKFANPADHPYEVISNGLAKSQKIIEGSKTKLRPWLQAFDLGAVYDGAKIRAQITAVEEAENTAGWLLWNASNRYSDKGLNPAGKDLQNN